MNKILIKYGGNAMCSEQLSKDLMRQIKELQLNGYTPILVHGGGPFINHLLKLSDQPIKFINGQRVTLPENMPLVEAALNGMVNGFLVEYALLAGLSAVGLSGKDGRSVISTHSFYANNLDKDENRALGRVGNVAGTNTDLYEQLLKNGFMPIISSIACDQQGLTFNINADYFASALACALNVSSFIVLTDTDGIYKDKNKADSLISDFYEDLLGDPEIQISDGMIPKVHACLLASKGDVENVQIVNANEPDVLLKAVCHMNVGTRFIKKRKKNGAY